MHCTVILDENNNITAHDFDGCNIKYANFASNKWNTVIIREIDFSDALIIKVILENINLTRVHLFKSNIKIPTYLAV